MNPLATVYSASHNESICALYYLCFKKLSISFRCHFVQMCAQSRRQPIETAICFMIVLKQLVYRGFGCCFRVGTTFTVIANEWNWTEEAEKNNKNWNCKRNMRTYGNQCADQLMKSLKLQTHGAYFSIYRKTTWMIPLQLHIVSFASNANTWMFGLNLEFGRFCRIFLHFCCPQNASMFVWMGS